MSAPRKMYALRRALVAAHAVARWELQRVGSDLACSRDSADAAVQLLATAAERIGEGATTGRAICAMVQVRDSFETRRMARLVAAAVEGHPLAVDALERITRGAIGLVLPLVSRQNEGARLRLFEEL